MNFWSQLWETVKSMFKSRKFWALLTSLVTILAGYSTGELTVLQAVVAVVSALSAYSGFVALEDGLSRRG